MPTNSIQHAYLLHIGWVAPRKGACTLEIVCGLAMVQVEKQTTVVISGYDKEQVGQFAAKVRAKRPPEPYKQKGVRYVDEVVRKKEGKRGK